MLILPKKKEFQKVYIYTLSNPITKEARYVGRCFYPKYRLNGHIREGRKLIEKTVRPTKKRSWIASLLKQNLKPILDIVEVTYENCWQEREKFWIKQFFNLTNMIEGGDSYCSNKGKKFGKMTEERRSNVKAGIKKVLDNPIRKQAWSEFSKRGNATVRTKILINGKLRNDIKNKISNTLKQQFKLTNKLTKESKAFKGILDCCKELKISYNRFQKIRQHKDKEYNFTLFDELELV